MNTPLSSLFEDLGQLLEMEIGSAKKLEGNELQSLQKSFLIDFEYEVFYTDKLIIFSDSEDYLKFKKITNCKEYGRICLPSYYHTYYIAEYHNVATLTNILWV